MTTSQSKSSFTEWISGREAEFSLEHRIFNVLCFSILVFVFLALAVNIGANLHPTVLLVNYIAIGVALTFQYLARFRRMFSVWLINVYLVISISCYCVVWFFNGGIDSPVGYLFLMSMVIFVFVSPINYYKWVAMMFVLCLVALFVLEYLNPEWPVAYPDRESRYFDHLATVLYAAGFILFAIVATKINYNKERQKVDVQRTHLERINKELTDKNQKIEILMKELNHRVKNNLQVITSLLNLQINKVKDSVAKEAIQDSKNRLLAMVLLHQQLYKGAETTTIRIDEYITSLLDNIMLTYGIDPENSFISTDLDRAYIWVESAIPIGLIINELVSNCFKHAFEGELSKAKIQVSLFEKEKMYHLIVSDNGKGMPQNTDINFSDTFGLELIRSLCEQIEASIVQQNNHGASFIIHIPKKMIV